MHKVGVVGDKDSILAFKALGVDVYPVVTKEEARKRIDSLANEKYGIIFVTEQVAALVEETVERYNKELTPAIILIPNNQGSFIWNYLRGQQFKKLLKGKTASIYATSMAPTWWYKVFSGSINIPDSYGISVLKNAVLNHCGIKTKKVSILGELGREVNTNSTRQKYLQKVAEEVKALD